MFPHDVAVREMSTGHSRQEYAYQLGMRPIKICPKLPIEDGLHAGQMLLSKTFIDREHCKPFLDAMKWYHLKYVDKDKTIPLDPGYEDIEKIQKVQSEGITPHSQKFGKTKKWQPAFEGADHSKEELEKMSKKEKKDYYE